MGTGGFVAQKGEAATSTEQEQERLTTITITMIKEVVSVPGRNTPSKMDSGWNGEKRATLKIR